MKIFALWCVVAVVVFTVLAAFSVSEGAQAAAIGGGGFACLMVALCFYALASIHALIQRGK